MEVPDIEIGVVTNPDDVTDFWQWLTSHTSHVGCDIETGSDPEGSELIWHKPGFHVRMVQFGDRDTGWAVPAQGWPDLVRGAFAWLHQHRVKMIWHNGFTFDYKALLAAVDIRLEPSLIEDTFVYAGLGGYAGESRELKACAAETLGEWALAGQDILKTGMKNAGWSWTSVPMDWQPYPTYGALDVVIGVRLWEAWEDRRAEFGEHHSLEIATAMQTNAMAIGGMMADGRYLRKTITEYQQKERALVEQAQARGWPSLSNDNGIRRVLLESGVLDELHLTPGGAISMDAEQMLNASSRHPLAKLVLDYRKTHKYRSDYLEKIFRLGGNQEHPFLIHPDIWSMEARTGRMSVSNPPMQQIPSGDTVVRNAFIPRAPDEVLISADYGQIEMRLWGSLNGDKKLMDMFTEADKTGEDFFVLLARDLYGDPNFQKSDPRRTVIKSSGYATIFAGGPDTIAKTAGVPIDVAVPIIQKLGATYPSFKDLGESMIQDETLDGGTKVHRIYTPTGRRFQVRNYKERRKLPNYADQGHAAEILKMATVGIAAAGLGPNLVMAVHDELVLSVKAKDAEEIAQEVKLIMDSVVDPAEYGVAIKAKPGIGKRWGYLK